MSLFFGILGMLGFPIALVVWLVAFFKKKAVLKKFSGIALILFFISFVVGIILTPPNNNVSKNKTELTSKQIKKIEANAMKKGEAKAKKEAEAKAKKEAEAKAKKEAEAKAKKEAEAKAKKEAEAKAKKEAEAKAKKEAEAKEEAAKPVFDDAANAAFADYLTAKLNENFANSGVTQQVYARGSSNVSIYMTVPQDYKYASNTQIQELADLMLSAKNQQFTKWLSENGFSSDVTAPYLYIQTEDGTNLAKESLWSGNMKLKINNN
ncbi:cell envelope integrity inner membrane protein TolA [Streptococcus parauberis]|uniref:hypothetical protein n=1 Tax=Streptococcus parauberis TaxID=1348 RepID=UPI000CCECF3F|nr:hypothetical protein [Streptococcus parauberis]PNY22394.1 cell envelope integrity inner membrane protein TolA [Streptococcus parauberis]